MRDSILLRFHTRAYKQGAGEKWEVATGCLKVIHTILKDYSPEPEDFANKRASEVRISFNSVITRRSISVLFFPHPQANSESGRHPGFTVMVHLLQTSELLRMLLMILDEGVNLLETYSPFAGKEQLEMSTRLCLQILERALDIQVSCCAKFANYRSKMYVSHQGSFLDAARKSNSPLMLTQLEQLLLGVNPRTGSPDHMLCITRYKLI